MKKALKSLFIFVCVFAMILSVAACSQNNTDPTETATPTAAPTEESNVVTPDPAATYTVTFNSNGGSEVAAQKIESGKYAAEPEDPVKEGFSFDGWFSDEALTALFDFANTAVMADVTLYAGWEEAQAGPSDGSGKATFYWNYDVDGSGTTNDAGDIYQTVSFNYGTNISKVADPAREGYVFGGWYLEDGAEYNRLAKYKADVNAYAKWVIKYTFEAERTQLTGLDYDCEENQVYDTVTEGGLKVGVALSGSCNGAAMIGSSTKASGGRYVAGLDYKGAYLDFEFTSDKAESGVALSMKLSARFRTLYMSAATNSSKIEIKVNGKAISYDDITIERPDNAQDMDGIDCEDYFKTIFINTIDIQEGENVIRIYVNNDSSRTDGTVRAYAPVVDCIYLSSTSTLTFKEYENQ